MFCFSIATSGEEKAASALLEEISLLKLNSYSNPYQFVTGDEFLSTSGETVLYDFVKVFPLCLFVTEKRMVAAGGRLFSMTMKNPVVFVPSLETRVAFRAFLKSPFTV